MLTGDNVHNTIRNAQSVAEVLGICYHLIHHFPRLAVVRRRQTELLHLHSAAAPNHHNHHQQQQQCSVITVSSDK